MNSNIQIGIDLGTTNSEVAVFINDEIQIVKNIFQDDYTPSVFGYDKSGNKVIGKKAYEKLFKNVSSEEEKNFKAEIKRLMGTNTKVYFNRVDKNISPEEISSEILKSLKSDVQRKYNDINISAAVITIPAYFSTLQAEATARAGNLSGFEYVVLLQEPIAAAMAYGFSNAQDENCLVYDLGGGTFDIALVSSKEGILAVVEQSGDNFLGGKDFDNIIVDKIIIPEILSKYVLFNFNRANEKYKYIFPKLKYFAESAKIDLTHEENTTIDIENIGTDDNGKNIFLSLDISRKKFEELISPLVDRTIELAKQTILSSGVNSKSIKKIVLVGCSTLIPYVRKNLVEELQIPIDTSSDPLTAIAKGAAIYALSQQIPNSILKKEFNLNDQNIYEVELEYDSLTADSETFIGGVIKSLASNKDEYYIEIKSKSNYYASPKITLKNGKFSTIVALENNKSNFFELTLYDRFGKKIDINPSTFNIAQSKINVIGIPLPSSIGVSIQETDNLINRSVDKYFKFFEKGSILPLKLSHTFRTAKILRKENEDEEIGIYVFEGENPNPNNNTFICKLGVPAKDIPFDIPEGSDIDITISVNKSRVLEVEYYIPVADVSGNLRNTFLDEDINIEKLNAELEKEKISFISIEKNCSDEESHIVKTLMVSIANSLKDAEEDDDSKRKANKEIKVLKNFMEELNKSKEIDQLIDAFDSHIRIIEEFNEKFVLEPEEKETNLEQLSILKQEGEKAIKDNDTILLSKINNGLKDLFYSIYYSNPFVWIDKFNKLAVQKDLFINKNEAEIYIKKGEIAVKQFDIDNVKECVQGLQKLIPPDDLDYFNEDPISGIKK